MWDEDVQVRKKARAIVSSIADHRGGETSVLINVLCGGYDTAIHCPHLIARLEAEIAVSPISGFDLWMIITRLIRDRIVDVFGGMLEDWLQIPQVRCV